MLLRAILPVGWMPSGQTTGAHYIVVCTQMGGTQIAVDADGHRIPTPDKQDSSGGGAHPPCAFAAMAGLALPVVAAAVMPSQIVHDLDADLGVSFALDSARSAPWQSRAPPAVAHLI